MVMTGAMEDSQSRFGADRAEPIAIIGLDARLPGAGSLALFWQNLTACKESVGPPPDTRPEASGLGPAGYLEDVSGFDADFFAISDEEARLMDPIQRLALESAWHCVEEAGWRPADLAKLDTGVFVATGKSDYEECMQKAELAPTGHLPTGVASALVANRISFSLGLTGPSIAVDTACSGGLTALHLAAQAIRAGDCEAALVGAVNVILNSTLSEELAEEGALSPDGRTRSFDSAANGYARGEGAAFLLLKPLRRAKADGDHIHGLMLGSAICHGGRANWLTAPNPAAQKDLIIKAWRRAQVDPRSITYVEAHGTGTPLGDPIEFNALRKADEAMAAEAGGSEGGPPCSVGSLKPNIGHLEAVSGLAGVIKVLLAMRHGQIPGHPTLADPNTMCKTTGTRLRLARQTGDWTRPTNASGAILPRRAGVSAFGFGGALGHVVLEEPPPVSAASTRIGNDHVLPILPVSAKTQAGLDRYVRALAGFAGSGDAPALSDFLYTFQCGRVCLPQRIAFLAESWPSLSETLDNWLEGRGDARILSSAADAALPGSGDELVELAVAFARQWIADGKPDFAALYGESRARRVSAPVYPFSRKHVWFETAEARVARKTEPRHGMTAPSGPVQPGTGEPS
ncbi:polyketide synthase [Martelella limonii]|uniref:beta-ketoacyl [acyl carrier protein] synthase domain-containing protein n=1 Tax=Martelella limonii TaxID=1647649 RepID=UPI0015802FF7|nr:polyketide synthase [Martelella limonii]